jgi:hypothetical protein
VRNVGVVGRFDPDRKMLIGSLAASLPFSGAKGLLGAWHLAKFVWRGVLDLDNAADAPRQKSSLRPC